MAVLPALQIPDIYGDVQEGLKNGYRRGAISAAQSYAKDGDYENAIKATAIYAPDAAKSYSDLSDRAYSRQVAPAIASGDFKTARSVAGKHGDLETVLKLPAVQLQQHQQMITRYIGGLQAIDQMPMAQRQAAYSELKARAKAETQQAGEDPSLIDQLLPDQYNPYQTQQLTTGLIGVKDQMELALKQQEVTANAAEAKARGGYYGAMAGIYGAGPPGGTQPGGSDDDAQRQQEIMDRAARDPAFAARARAAGMIP